MPQERVDELEQLDVGDALSDVFFRELELAEPDLNLGVGSGSHAAQTAATMTALASALPNLDPAILVL